MITEEELIKENNRLNDTEFESKCTTLKSYPRAVFVQMDAPCNQDCLFCSRPEAYSHFDLEEFKRAYEKKLLPVFQRAERINLTGSGELLLLPRAKDNLNYFNGFKYAEKMFATNGSSLTPKMVDFILESGSRYVVHVSIHSCDASLHRTMTKSDNFGALRENLDYLKKAKTQTDKLKVNFIFVATTSNIEALPEFVNFAKDNNADSVIAYYNYIYRLGQKRLSCYFAKEKTNRSIDLARAEADRGNIGIFLPPKFENHPDGNGRICREAWSNLMINTRGDIITCDVAGDSRETLAGKEFMEVWNGEYYSKIRTVLAGGDYACSKFCFRSNPSAVNDFRSHFITRGMSDSDVEKFMEGV